MTAAQCIKTVRDRLKNAGIESYDYESRQFLEWLAGIDRADYYMNPNQELTAAQWERIDAMVTRREHREPLQYLMGSCDFFGYEFHVDERVLIPRQDTECLVELALDWIRRQKLEQKHKQNQEQKHKQNQEQKQEEKYEQKHEQKYAQKDSFRVLDLCSGSGCIGISVKLSEPDSDVTLADLSEDALDVSLANAERLGADVHQIHTNLFENVSGQFDAIMSNPPYIPTEVCQGLMPEVRDHEPMMALDGDQDGLSFYRRITEDVSKYLKSGGALFFEIGAEQGEAVSNLMREAGLVNVQVHKDLAGLDRIVSGVEP